MKTIFYLKLSFVLILTTIFLLSLTSCGPKGHRHGKHDDSVDNFPAPRPAAPAPQAPRARARAAPRSH